MRYFLDSIKKKNRRYEIVINDENFKTTYKIREELLIEMKFLSPKEIKEDDYKLFLSKLPLDSLIYEGEKFADKKLRTSKEVKDHLREITNDESMINDVVEILKKENLINDSSYKKAYLEYAIYEKKEGRMKISNDLVKLGLNNSFEYDTEALKENITLLTKKYVSKDNKTPFNKLVLKTKKYLLSKGYTEDEINKYLNISLIPKNSSSSNLEEDYKKAKAKYNDKQKIKMFLLRKGYGFNSVETIVGGDDYD